MKPLSTLEWVLLVASLLMLGTVLYMELRGPLPYCWTVRPPKVGEPGIIYGLGKLQTEPGECDLYEFLPVVNGRN